MSLGSRIKALRKGKEKNQQWLADLVGVSQVMVSQWEKDQKNPGVDNVYKIAEALGVNPGELLSDQEQEPRVYPFPNIANVYRDEANDVTYTILSWRKLTPDEMRAGIEYFWKINPAPLKRGENHTVFCPLGW